MARKRTKKVNPRRIPLAKREINENAILEGATKNDLYEAWPLVFHALIELELIPFEEMPVLTELVNQYITAKPKKVRNGVPDSDLFHFKNEGAKKITRICREFSIEHCKILPPLLCYSLLSSELQSKLQSINRRYL